MKKGVFLGVMLLLPLAILVFLKKFGKNEYSLPVLHSKMSVEYLNPNIASEEIGVYINVGVGTEEDRRFIIQNLDRIIDKLKIHEDVKLFLYTDSDREKQNSEDYFIVNKNYESIEWKLDSSNAFLNFTEPLVVEEFPEAINKALLIDKGRQLRGVYDLSNEEEFDRISLELQILKYK
ncbi:hypothetical protein [Aureibacter tunicatorum]|uniref:Uncharacterized protein n=1 Tax=Aureibacter tunicatorum TaxID=866807 RepID=A0AAE4BSL8_9BACT|nr:hypothetical protein [Aureibacter tunicatorum]MDR6238990.1 hypothetical protein [Aureibacter tunicatorum]BDD05084.1 hypothetical protein AUTU_25670 [Aureibacter tunicatorum]